MDNQTTTVKYTPHLANLWPEPTANQRPMPTRRDGRSRQGGGVRAAATQKNKTWQSKIPHHSRSSHPTRRQNQGLHTDERPPSRGFDINRGAGGTDVRWTRICLRCTLTACKEVGPAVPETEMTQTEPRCGIAPTLASRPHPEVGSAKFDKRSEGRCLRWG